MWAVRTMDCSPRAIYLESATHDFDGEIESLWLKESYLVNRKLEPTFDVKD